jgi:hypothetical protein
MALLEMRQTQFGVTERWACNERFYVAAIIRVRTIGHAACFHLRGI